MADRNKTYDSIKAYIKSSEGTRYVAYATGNRAYLRESNNSVKKDCLVATYKK